jgi:predicted dehydrogenase
MAKLGIGIIGAGGIAQSTHIPGYLACADRCELVAVADVDGARARDVADRFGIPNVYEDYHDLLTRKDVQAVSIATPNREHKAPAIAALESGKHVLLEKPMAMNAAECKEILAAQRKTGAVLQIGLQFRFSSVGRFLGDYVQSGRMGDVYYARAMALRRRGVPTWGVFTDKEKQGGGPLIDIGVHILDFTLFAMGYPKPVSASGKTWQVLGKDPSLWNYWGDYDREAFTVEDFAVGQIRFENGAVVTLESSFMANLGDDQMRSELFGTRSGATVDLLREPSLTFYTEEHRQLFDMIPRNLPRVDSMYTEEIRAFLKAIEAGGQSPVPGEQGLILNAIFDAIYRSSESGREEPVDTDL